MDLNKRIKTFISLGEFLSFFKKDVELNDNSNVLLKKHYNSFNNIVKTSYTKNAWFTEENIRNAITSISESLKEENIKKWIKTYIKKFNINKISKRVGVVMAGNIPVVGFHDFLCVLISGNIFAGKLSSQDPELLPAIAKVLIDIEPEFKDKIEFTDKELKDSDVIIATGSDNTSRYFVYYFGKYPNIIRKNRNGVAVISGNETQDELRMLGEDIFTYFGLGCRNVSKLFVPKPYSFDKFFEAVKNHKNIIKHYKYSNNYDYYKSIYLINKTVHLDNGFLMLKEDEGFSSPISVIYYEYYDNKNELNNLLNSNADKIQCLISNDKEINSCISFGKSQSPQLWDYADGIDTMEFLLGV